MTLPSPRNSIRPLRGLLATLQADIAGIGEGEVVYATDENRFYVKENGILTVASATAAQGILADTAVQPTDNVSDLTNDAGYLTLADIANTTNKFAYVNATVGDDLTAELDNPGKPFASIRAASDEITAQGFAGYAIEVAPGNYAENNPIQLRPGCIVLPAHSSVSNVHGSVVVSPLNNNDHLFLLAPNAQVDGIQMVTPTSFGFACAAYIGGAEIANTVASVTNVKIVGGAAGSLGTGVRMAATSGNGKIISFEIRYGGGAMFHLLECKGGILATESVHVPGTANPDDFIHAVTHTDTSLGNSLARFQGVDVNSGSPDVEYIYHNIGGTGVFFGINYFNGQKGILLESDSYDISFFGGLLDAATDTIIADAGITGVNGKLFIGAKMNEQFNIQNNAWWNSDYLFEFNNDATDINAYTDAKQIWGGDLILGHQRETSGLFVGYGTAFSDPATDTVLATSNNTSTTEGNGLVDLTATALDKDDATQFTFNANAANEAIYFCTDKRDPTNNLLKHYGYRTGHFAGDSRDGEYAFEIWNGTEWTEVDIQAVNRDLGYNYASNVMWRGDDSHEYILFGLDDNTTWSLTVINGKNAYWSRIRIVTPPTTLPTLYQIQGLPRGGFEITGTGKQIFYGVSQFRRSLQSASSGLSATGGVLTGTQQVGTGVNQYAHSLADGTLDGAGDKVYWNIRMPEGTCTAFPFYIDILYSIQSGFNAVTLPQLGFTFHPAEVAGMYVADPNGGLAPVVRNNVDTSTITTNNPQRQVKDIPGDAADTMYNLFFGPFMATDFYEGDLLAMSLDYVDDGSSNADINIWDISLRSFRWTEGERQV